MFDVSSRENHGHKRRGHDFGISHVVLPVFRMVERCQEVGTGNKSPGFGRPWGASSGRGRWVASPNLEGNPPWMSIGRNLS
jgi:hypothetical protein